MKIDQQNNHLNVLLAACVLALIFFYIDSMWSTSVDLAHVYALTYRISEQWVLMGTQDPTLGKMNIYPRGSHIIAAFIGFLFHSTFLGIQIVTLASLALLWLGVLFILQSLRARIALSAVLSLVAIVILNSLTLKLDTHGHEIVGNFFYSQFVGQAILFIGIPVAIANTL